MFRSLVKLVTGSAFAVALILGVTGCAVWVPRDFGVSAGIGVDYYSPSFYRGSVVYYNGFGYPYYYTGGRMVYVPRTYSGYGALVRHHNRYAPEYRRWYRNEGYRYRDYRAPGGRLPPSVRVTRGVPYGKPYDHYQRPSEYARPPGVSAHPSGQRPVIRGGAGPSTGGTLNRGRPPSRRGYGPAPTPWQGPAMQPSQRGAPAPDGSSPTRAYPRTRAFPRDSGLDQGGPPGGADRAPLSSRPFGGNRPSWRQGNDGQSNPPSTWSSRPDWGVGRGPGGLGPRGSQSPQPR